MKALAAVFRRLNLHARSFRVAAGQQTARCRKQWNQLPMVAGVTVVEMMVVLTIMAILTAIALPGLSGFITSIQIRSAADNLRSGVHLAQAEALRRNGNVEIVMTDAAPSTASVQPVASGGNWVVRQKQLNGQYKLIQSFVGSTGRAGIKADRPLVAFDSFGRLAADSQGGAAPSDISIDFFDKAAGDPSKSTLRIVIRRNGSTASCNPSQAVGGIGACN